ncbi:hypothetical protein PVAP13_3NG027700 [Panicum virgatum]|uniref:Secreted protein n=1 Tax=Panicum virgatum TaxID=38727 RepID=A0A8T0TSQ6_PANVG|nr:hypothetical protein PVAP13_3NG027700 [Panicum virgatum]
MYGHRFGLFWSVPFILLGGLLGLRACVHPMPQPHRLYQLPWWHRLHLPPVPGFFRLHRRRLLQFGVCSSFPSSESSASFVLRSWGSRASGTSGDHYCPLVAPADSNENCAKRMSCNRVKAAARQDRLYRDPFVEPVFSFPKEYIESRASLRWSMNEHSRKVL